MNILAVHHTVLEQGVPKSACGGTHGEAAFAGPDAHNWPSQVAAAHTGCQRSADSYATCLGVAALDR